jgi:hypothetical protein
MTGVLLIDSIPNVLTGGALQLRRSDDTCGVSVP